MKRQPKKYTHCGYTAMGKTVAAAKEQWIKDVTDVLANTGGPRVIPYPGHNDAAIIYKLLNGWGYRLLSSGCVHICDKRDDAIESALFHLAQIYWLPEHGSNVPPILYGHPKREAFYNWTVWNLAYRTAQANGLDDAKCREIAEQSVGVAIPFSEYEASKITKPTEPPPSVRGATSKSIIRYVWTYIDKGGNRTLAEPRQGRYTYPTLQQAQRRIDLILENSSKDTLDSVYGKDAWKTFEPRPVECYAGHFDPMNCWFD